MVLTFSYFIGNRIEELDKKIRSIQLPKLLRTNLHPISEREFFHAHDWKYMLLFVAYPLLNGILPERCKYVYTTL